MEEMWIQWTLSCLTILINGLFTYIIARKIMKQTLDNAFEEVLPRIKGFLNTQEGQGLVYAVGVLVAKGAQAGLGIKLPAQVKKFKITGISWIDELAGQVIGKALQKHVGSAEKPISEEEDIFK